MRDERQVLEVFLRFTAKPLNVGLLAYREGRAFFEYVPEFLASGIEISPFKLPLRPGVAVCEDRTFDGMFGVFDDCLADGWGRLLLDRHLRKCGYDLGGITPLDRLRFVGTNGTGALRFVPQEKAGKRGVMHSLDLLARESAAVLADEKTRYGEELFCLAGSSCGARPKITAYVSADGKTIASKSGKGLSAWLIKFCARADMPHAGREEYAYALAAKAAGISMPDVRLFETKHGAYFGAKRFDRLRSGSVHMHSVSGLLHASHRYPALDYLDLLKLTKILTKDIREEEAMFRLACFNVFAKNRDDHSKNFSFLMDARGAWTLSPAYDLTPSAGLHGEHATTVLGKGRDISAADLCALGLRAGLKKDRVTEIVDAVRATVLKMRDFRVQAGLR
jgi:serine/threonine-protein kinase HipA